MDINVIVDNDNNELYLELNIFYNIGLIILGIIAYIFNIFFIYIIWKERLWKQSIQYVFQILISGSGMTLGLRNIIVGIINLTVFDSSIPSYDFLICKIKYAIDILILYVFELSFGFRMANFTILIGRPVFYKNYLENVRNKKYLVIILLFFPIMCTLFYILDINDSKITKNCRIHSFMGEKYKYFFVGFLVFIDTISIPTLIYGLYKVVKLNLNKSAKDNVIRLSNYYNFIYIIFLVLPFNTIVISFFLRADSFLIGLYYDVSMFSIAIVAIVDFIFAILHNKPVKDTAMKMLKVKNKVSFLYGLTN
uniref:G_PROTEIN_RECEP_F1_2 domain-containing protein n=1 Tax=Strongyloides venezuelensis TaxID=75913 RepID=A0A0K0G5R7_STRVS